MLILSRKPNESIMINDDVEIFVSSIVGNQVKLAFEAPKNIKIHRKEIWLKTKDKTNHYTKKEKNNKTKIVIKSRKKLSD